MRTTRRQPDSRRIAGALIPVLCLLGWPLARGAEPPEPFAIGSCHVNNRTVADLERWLPQMAAAGIRFHRTCQTNWNAVEPTEGHWTFTELDREMAYLTRHGIRCGGLLIGSVPWDRSPAAAGLPVANLPAWSNYVSTVVTHLRGKVTYWEVWNEPPNFIAPGQTAADYAKIVISAYDAAKAADPDCLIGLAAKSVHVNFLEQAILAGAKDHFDFITLHPYEMLGTVAEGNGTEPLFMNIVPTVRRMLAARNPAKAGVPILFTELGADTRKGADYPAQALVKAYTMGIAQGVTSIQWFEGRDGDSGPMGLLDRNGEPRPAYTAMEQMIRHLGQRPRYLGWVPFDRGNHGFVFQGAATTVLAVWASREPAAAIDFGQAVRIVEPLTGRQTTASGITPVRAPVLVLDVPAGMVQRAAANRARPLPWGGDFSKAKSVTLRLDGAPEENGLHTLSGDAIGAAVLAYGGSGRAGNVPGGNAFVIDPGFLCHTPVPIEIKVEVRRNPANDNAGFKLVYESTDGFKNLGWYTIPDNLQWHTVTWRLTDAQFVGMWGYHFLLESDGNQYNRYFIRSVTVTKL